MQQHIKSMQQNVAFVGVPTFGKAPGSLSQAMTRLWPGKSLAKPGQALAELLHGRATTCLGLGWTQPGNVFFEMVVN